MSALRTGLTLSRAHLQEEPMSRLKSIRWYREIVAVSAAAVLLSIASACDRGPGSWEGDRPVVTVAANFPMTGELGLYGASVQRGVQMALDDLVTQDSTGPLIRFDWGDNAGEPQTTVTVMQRHLLRSPDLYTSGFKPQVLAITEQLSQRELPHFTWILDIEINPGTSNNLRVWVNFDLETQVFLRYMEPRQPRRVAIMYVKTPAVEEQYAEVIAPALQAWGAEVMIERLEWDTSDFATLAAKINAFRPDMLILNGFVPQLPNQIRALRPFGLISNGNTLASLDMLEAASLLGPDESEGIIVAAPTFLTQGGGERVQEWRARFVERYGEEPLYHSAYAYDMVLVIHDAAQRLTLPATSQQWTEAIRATQIEGVTGSLVFNDDGSVITSLAPAVYRGGQLVPLAEGEG
jgi:branched-chain amino acid transport system substrate-binding protein